MPTAHFASDLASADGIRSFVEQGLRREVLGEDALFHAQLLATELVTNAVRHAGSPVELTVSRRGDRIRIEARDASTTRPVPPRADASTRHRGLLLVEDLSEAWGVDVQDHHGKVVWCEVAAA
jgi:anti-sigma regulatory factor (Ser/Thr protein kinase)